MSRSYLSPELRLLVATRADHLCEYCLIHEEDTFFGCQVDHVISEKHGGATDADNLAYACSACNRNKGSDVGSVLPPTAGGQFVRFFDPRSDNWADHFCLEPIHGLRIVPVTDIGVVTERILRFNAAERLLERQALRELGRYPSGAAVRRMLRTWGHEPA